MTTWQMARPFLLRSAGFRANLVEELVFDETARAIDDVLDAEASTTELAETLKLELRPVWASRRDSGLRWKALQKRFDQRTTLTEAEIGTCADDAYLVRRLEAWNDAVARLAAARSSVEATFARETIEKRKALREIAKDTRLQEAVFLSSPSMSDGVAKLAASPVRAARSSEEKRVERQVAMYIQRVATKNETTSFFGPLGYGRFGEASTTEGAWPIRWKQEAELGKRETFVAHWAVQSLAAAFSRVPEVRAISIPRLEPTLVVKADGLCQLTTGKTHALAPSILGVVRRIDGAATVEEIAGRDERTARILEQLEAKGLVEIGFEPPITEARAFEALVRFASACPIGAAVVRWRESLAELARLKAAFSPAALEEKAAIAWKAQRLFEELTGEASSRSGGEIYADRALFYEECRSGREHIEADARFTEKAERSLGRLLDLYARHGAERALFLERLGREIFEALFPGERAVPFLRFLGAVQASPRREEWQRRVQSFESDVQQRLRSIVRARANEAVVALTEGDLEDAERGAPSIDRTPLLCSPDIMIGKNPDGSPLLILGEAHDTIMLWGWALGFHPDKEALADEMWRFAEGLGLEHTANLLPSRRKKIVPFEYPGLTLEHRALSSEARNPRRALSEVDVRLQSDGLALSLRASNERIHLHNGELYSLAHSLFALPRCVPFSLDLGDRTPRIVFDGVVVQRARQRLTRGTAGLASTYPGTSLALFERMRRLKRELGASERVFVKLSTEPKPFFVDFRSFFLLEAWEALFVPEAACVVSEMLPDLNELWLTDHSGERVTSELRTSFGRLGQDNQARGKNDADDIAA